MQLQKENFASGLKTECVPLRDNCMCYRNAACLHGITDVFSNNIVSFRKKLHTVHEGICLEKKIAQRKNILKENYTH